MKLQEIADHLGCRVSGNAEIEINGVAGLEDVTLLGAEPNTGFLEVPIAIAPKEVAEEAIRYARAWGFSPQRVTAPAPAEGFPRGPLFIQVAKRSSETRTLRGSAARKAGETRWSESA